MTRSCSMLMVLMLALAAFGCDTVEPRTGMVVLYASVDEHRSTSDSATLVAPLGTEADDPRSYAYLIQDAGKQFGVAPSRVTVTDLSLVLGDDDWTVGFDDLFAGDLEIGFQPTGSSDSYLVATVPQSKVARAGAGIVVNDATFDSDALPEADRAKILAGDFEVTLHAAAGPAFAAHRSSLVTSVPIIFQVHP
jgi:hypothetical protein